MKVRVRVKRQATPRSKPFWEEFEVAVDDQANVISCLQQIQKHPRTFDGRLTSPVAWDSNCLEEICGACTMNVNGRVRQACSALVAELKQPLVLEPMQKFPAVRDLVVDRSSMFENLKRVRAWVGLDGTHAQGPGPSYSAELAASRYEMSRCMMCGCCLEACPQVNDHSPFVGAAVLNQVVLMNSHPTGHAQAGERLHALMADGGAADCGNAQNCVKVCPKGIPLVDSIGKVNRDITVQMLKDLFNR